MYISSQNHTTQCSYLCSVLSVCSQMEKGVFMMLGERRFESSSIIEAYTQTFHMPYLSLSFADNVVRSLPTFQIHLRPSHTQALVDVITHFSWRSFHYVYDTEEGMVTAHVDILCPSIPDSCSSPRKYIHHLK